MQMLLVDAAGAIVVPGNLFSVLERGRRLQLDRPTCLNATFLHHRNSRDYRDGG